MPRRRCAGCGRVAPKQELVRFALQRERGGTALAVIDRAGTMPGRGAYLCRAGTSGLPASGCAELAARRGSLARTLRCPVELEPAYLVESGR